MAVVAVPHTGAWDDALFVGVILILLGVAGLFFSLAHGASRRVR